MPEVAGQHITAEPFVSIVTVCLDAAATIEDTLASVALQRTRFRTEHLVVDGGSRDGTRTLVNRWAQHSNHIRRIYEPDAGIFDAMNKGLQAARGEYVLFLNADDFLVSHDTLDRILAGLSPGSEANPDLVLGDVEMGVLGRHGVWRHRRVPRALARRRGTGLFPPHQGMFAKRLLLLRVGGFDAGLRLAACVNQYYDLERLFEPSIRIVGVDTAFMRAGGAANAGVRAMLLGSVEIFRHQRQTRGAIRSAAMVFIKTLQSVGEIRYGRPRHGAWMGQQSIGSAE